MELPGKQTYYCKNQKKEWQYICNTLPETSSKRTCKWAIPKGNQSSNHWFSGAMLVSGRVNFTFARGEVLDHSTAGPTGVPMHRSARCMRGWRRPVKRSHNGPHMKSERQKMFVNFCWWCLYTWNLWVCPLFWGFNFNPPKEGWTKLQSKKGSIGLVPGMYLF